MRIVKYFAVAIVLCFVCKVGFSQEPEPKEKVNLFELVLAEYDLKFATSTLNSMDLNEDSQLDSKEQGGLNWEGKVRDFDLNKDRKITHLEIAIYHAKVRHDNDITQFDINNATRLLRRADKNSNGQLEPKELEAGWPPNPDEHDTNNDGIISEREAIRYMAFMRGFRRQMGIDAVDHSRAGRIMLYLDKDKNRKLDADEYAKTYIPEPVRDFDTDDDKMLDLVELATMYSKHRRDLGLTKPDQIKINSMFSTFDLDRNGEITEQELSMMVFADNRQERYKEFDANGDGTLSMAEVEKHFAKVRKERGYIEVDFDLAVKQLRRHDTNKSKAIEAHELFDGETKGRLSKKVMSKADRDQDERISLDELARYYAAQRKANQ